MRSTELLEFFFLGKEFTTSAASILHLRTLGEFNTWYLRYKRLKDILLQRYRDLTWHWLSRLNMRHQMNDVIVIREFLGRLGQVSLF